MKKYITVDGVKYPRKQVIEAMAYVMSIACRQLPSLVIPGTKIDDSYSKMGKVYYLPVG